jgi:hypothetical protein
VINFEILDGGVDYNPANSDLLDGRLINLGLSSDDHCLLFDAASHHRNQDGVSLIGR